MNRRSLLALAGASVIGGLTGCIGGSNDEGTDTNDEETDTEAENELGDLSGSYDFSSCEYDLNEERINVPLDESHYNDPTENDEISVELGYQEDIEDDELEELDSLFGDVASHSEGARSYSTSRDAPIHKCDVAKLSNRDYVEFIIPFPVDE